MTLTPRPRRDTALTLLSPVTVTKKQLNKKYNYVDLEQLDKEESLFYQMAQLKLKEFREKAEAISPSRSKRKEQEKAMDQPPQPIPSPKRQSSPKKM